ncbi:MAG: small multi-drug export protein [bacterium]|nr:small multi-drug export protein [bacterium]
MLGVDWAQIFTNFPPEIAVLLIAMIPVAELRAAIPIGMTVFDLSIITTFIWAVIGNIIPVCLLLWWLEPISRWLSAKSRLMARFFDWLFDRTRRKHGARFERSAIVALILFVAVPLPITGGWTGSVAAFVFGVPWRKALVSISIGIVIAASIVTMLTLGAQNIL